MVCGQVASATPTRAHLARTQPHRLGTALLYYDRFVYCSFSVHAHDSGVSVREMFTTLFIHPQMFVVPAIMVRASPPSTWLWP